MANYRIIWEIDEEAETPEEAARQALRTMQDTDSIANVFKVIDEDGNEKQIDLQELDYA